MLGVATTKQSIVYALALLAVFGSVQTVLAGPITPITYSASVGTRLASAEFKTSGTDLLIVTLTNTSTYDAMVPVDILTAVFFDISGSTLALGRTSAVVPSTSTIFFEPIVSGGVVGGEWAYRSGLVGAPSGAQYGIGSAGFGLFGPGDLFPGSNLQGPSSPDGLQYGITSAGDNMATGNAAVTGSNALIRNEVVFTLSGLPTGFDPSTRIGNVTWQYGTDLCEPNIPEPATLLLFALTGLPLVRRRRAA